MQPALHIRTLVLPGNRVEVTAPELQEGEAIEVFLVRPEAQVPLVSSLQIIESLKGHRLFQDASEVSRRLNEERDSWDR
jgi:hypothetical protein